MKREKLYYKASDDYTEERKSYGVIDPTTLGEIGDAYYNGMVFADKTFVEKIEEFVNGVDIEKYFCDIEHPYFGATQIFNRQKLIIDIVKFVNG